MKRNFNHNNKNTNYLKFIENKHTRWEDRNIEYTEKNNDVAKNYIVDHVIFDNSLIIPYLNWNSAYSVGLGFLNGGNTCHFNSLLQCLIYTPSFTQIIFNLNELNIFVSENGVLSTYQT